MWRWGFTLWRAWVWARLVIPAGLLLWLSWHVWGSSARFGLVVLITTAFIGGAGFVLGDFARHELGARPRRRSR